jgi:hypothetical protein
MPAPDIRSVAVPLEERVSTPAPRVQLGFRDGSCADLDPSSSESLALRELADALTRDR